MMELPTSPSLLIQKATVTLECLGELGVTVNPGNRLEHARDTIQKTLVHGISLNPEDSLNPTRVKDAVRTIMDFYLVAMTSRTKGRDVPLSRLEKLQDMVGGAEQENPKDTRPRNTQFELLVSALLTLGNVEVLSEEPDLLFRYGHEWVGLAAKRLTSKTKSQLQNRAREAANQIRDAAMDPANPCQRGYIVLSLDPFVDQAENLPDVRKRVKRLQEIQPLLQRALKNQIEKKHQVIGVLGFATLSAWDETERSFATSVLPLIMPVCDEPEDRRLAHNFWSDFEVSLERQMQRVWR